MEVSHEALHRQLGVDGRLEVEHSGVGVLCDPLEHLVPEEQCDVLIDFKLQVSNLPALAPNVRLAVALDEFLLPALDHDPLYHHALEDHYAPEHPVQLYLRSE